MIENIELITEIKNIPPINFGMAFVTRTAENGIKFWTCFTVKNQSIFYPLFSIIIPKVTFFFINIYRKII